MRINTYRRFLVFLIVVPLFTSIESATTVHAQTLLDPLTLSKYIDPLPNPLGNIISPMGTMDGMDLYEVSMTQFTQQLHSELAPTTLWGYNGTYPGPTFETQRDVPIKVNWINDLVDTGGNPLPHLLPLDTTVHGAGAQFPEVRTVAHLHGGVVEPQSDGFPEHWFSADPNAPANGMGGPAGNSALYTYHNQQPASALWYHDHGMGITRLNVYAGLAGFYILRDPQEAALNLPSGDFEVPIVIQDRSFYDDGQLFYPRGPGDLTDPGGPDPLAGLPPEFPDDASVVPHYFGNTNLVNGKVWPILEVEPRKYRFRILNGSNARFYDLQLDAGPAGTLPFHQIGSDGGLLEATTTRSQMLMSPAERSDVIVDFSNLTVGDEVFLRNFGPDGPFESPTASYTPADPNTTGQVMKFKVVAPTAPDTSSLPTSLVSVPRIPESEAIVTRQLSLVEEEDEYGRPKLLLDGAKWTDPTTELPVKGTTEIWEITNSSPGSHPIHLHLVQFQVLDRFARPAGGGESVEVPLEAHELGWKDTFKVNRWETIRVIARFEDFDGLYVWHCHLLEHEDHEMMRRYEVVPGPELIVEQGVTLNLASPHTTPPGHIITVDGILNTPQLDVQGLLRGTGDVQASVTNYGTVSPGASPGILTVGEYTQDVTGKLKLDLAGTDNSDPLNPQFDQLIVAGDVTLDGQLDVSLVHPYSLIAGESYQIVDVGGTLTGTFAGLPELGFVGKYGSTNLFITYQGGDGNDIALLSAVPGDFDADGDFDGFDLLKWQRGESPFAWSKTDLADWEGNFGSPAPLSADSTTVPEPTGVLLLAVGLSLLSLCHSRCRRLLVVTNVQASNDCVVSSRAKPNMSVSHRNLKRTSSSLLLIVLALATACTEAVAAQISITPLKDNTLFGIADGSLSNGLGDSLFAGRTAAPANYLRRAVLAFDIAGSIPAGSTIDSVSLTLDMDRAQESGAVPFDLHSLLADWGEGASNASGQGGGGDDAEPGDATWIHTFYPSTFWSTPGGDFSPTISASTIVDAVGKYTWNSTPQLVADVQAWLDAPASNYGWLLKGPEDSVTAKRFKSRNITNVADRPTLLINFTSTGPLPFNWIGTGSGGVFQDGANWDAGVAPAAPTDVANLINTGTTDQIVTLSADISIDDLTIDGITNSMLLSVERGQTANVGDLTIGAFGGIDIELGKNSLGKVLASGAATLAGTLSLSTQGPKPSLTNTYEIMTYASRTGAFDNVIAAEIQPGLSFSVHYNDSRALAIVGQWVATAKELTGNFDVPVDLLVNGAWNWNGTLIKRGPGELTLDLDDGFAAGSSAALAIVEGTVRLQGTAQTLSLAALTYGELGALSGDASLAGLYGWYGTVAVPETSTACLAILGLCYFLTCERRRTE
ncbi:MAG: multicopper oxidase domain-containing protein [Planctomycetales bacterium]|nr:multicopper oxidase domain-containing protein [Planctomycetales bacterium]